MKMHKGSPLLCLFPGENSSKLRTLILISMGNIKLARATIQVHLKRKCFTFYNVNRGTNNSSTKSKGSAASVNLLFQMILYKKKTPIPLNK